MRLRGREYRDTRCETRVRGRKRGSSVKLPLGGPPAAEGEHAEHLDAARDEEDRVEVAPVGLQQHAGKVLRARAWGVGRAKTQALTVAPPQPLTAI